MWMYDEEAIFALLRDAGFKDIRRCTIGDSGDEMFDLVEEEGRFFIGNRCLSQLTRRPIDWRVLCKKA